MLPNHTISAYSQIALVLFLSMLLAIVKPCSSQEVKSYNLDFEKTDSSNLPADWKRKLTGGYSYQIDTSQKQNGKQSLSIFKKEGADDFAYIGRTLPVPLKGTELMVTAYIKTENVSSGFAGLMITVEGKNGDVLQFNGMQEHGITGTTPWQKYSLTVPLDASEAESCTIAILLAGTGKAWIDNMQLLANGKPLEIIDLKKPMPEKAVSDAVIISSSEILSKKISPEKIKDLTNLGVIWGFLKYYHPAIAQKNINCDSIYFYTLPKIMNAPDSKTANVILEELVTSLGNVDRCKNCNAKSPGIVKLSPDYGNLFTENNLQKTLIEKLLFIRDNNKRASNHPYFALAQSGNPDIKNELTYGKDPYPSSSVRLLALYRYWNIVQYFYPYRYVIKEDWNKILPLYIPRFINAANKDEYLTACLGLIAHIHDTHGNILNNNNTALDSLKGMYILPITAAFVESKLVITGYRTDDTDIRKQIKIGDIIEKIDQVNVDSLVKKFLPVTPASNYQRQLFEMISGRGFLLRSNKEMAELSLLSSTGARAINIQRTYIYNASFNEANSSINEKPAFSLLEKNIGYINPSKLNANDLDSIKQMFKNTDGVIIDLRCYPNTLMPFSYGSWLKKNPTPFVRFTHPYLAKPGSFISGDEVSNGGLPNNSSATIKNESHYKGKLVLIVNSITLSNAEYTAMALCTTPSAVVVGSQTAGADGDVSSFWLPGNIRTAISGLGVYYPDGGETQGVGIRINVPVQATIKGIREGKDEYLDKAVEVIQRVNK